MKVMNLKDDTQWDYIVVGTGVGGATIGYKLAQAGKKVLFCESGEAKKTVVDAPEYPELSLNKKMDEKKQDSILKTAGRCWKNLIDGSAFRSAPFKPFIGSGAGGSSSIFGMAFEKLLPSDFEPKACHPEAEGDNLPKNWPITFDELLPYYHDAEMLYRVKGEQDPLSTETQKIFPDGASLTKPMQKLCDHLEQKGLHPYRLPLACEFIPKCGCCQGFVCPKDCKNDSEKVCLRPAIQKYGAGFLSNCEVVRLEVLDEETIVVIAKLNGEEIELVGSNVVLSAGAIFTPQILLRSKSENHPNGLGNSSGLVGRNLMRHQVDLYLVKPPTKEGFDNRQKELAFNDFYHDKSQKLGSVQSFGRLPPVEVLFKSLLSEAESGYFFWCLPFIFRVFAPIIKQVLKYLVNQRLVLVTVMEDLPYEDNCLSFGDAKEAPEKIEICYKTKAYEKKRIKIFRKKMMNLFKPFKPILIKQAESNLRVAHMMGTCRFGNDPQTSVLDKNNQVHGIQNLLVVDSSFFPSSGGTNPSLTIAANALRVADVLLKKEKIREEEKCVLQF